MLEPVGDRQQIILIFYTPDAPSAATNHEGHETQWDGHIGIHGTGDSRRAPLSPLSDATTCSRPPRRAPRGKGPMRSRAIRHRGMTASKPQSWARASPPTQRLIPPRSARRQRDEHLAVFAAHQRQHVLLFLCGGCFECARHLLGTGNVISTQLEYNVS